jgi:hypothetical protein
MRTITLKYGGDCRKCGASLPVGSVAVHEKRVGVFCPNCAPSEVEEILGYRQEAADHRADKYEQWAEKRKAKASSLLRANEPYRGDHAFNTQPGHIPERARAIRRSEQAYEHMNTAEAFEAKAERLRHVRVAGDAARRDQARREANDAAITKGSRVFDHAFGYGVVLAIFKKSYRVQWERSGSVFARDKIFLRLEA